MITCRAVKSVKNTHMRNILLTVMFCLLFLHHPRTAVSLTPQTQPMASLEQAYRMVAREVSDLSQLPKHLDPRIAVIDLFNSITQERDRTSELLEEGLTEALRKINPGKVTPQIEIVRLRLEWNDAFPGEWRDPLAEDLAGQAEADWMLTGTHLTEEDMLQLRLELFDLTRETVLWQTTLEIPQTGEVLVFSADSPEQKSPGRSTPSPHGFALTTPSPVEEGPGEGEIEGPGSLESRPSPHPDTFVPEEKATFFPFAFMFPKPPEPPPPPPPPVKPPKGMVRIPGGEFIMGDPDGEADEQPDHLVVLSGFFLDEREVTNQEYSECRVCERGQGGFDTVDPEQPVVYVDWGNARFYCESLGKRLPTEAEWEYAARAAPNSRANPLSDESLLDEQAWYDANTMRVGMIGAQPVARKTANAWGLYDMRGNVMEWVNDFYAPDYVSLIHDSHDPKGTENPFNPDYPLRVARGGAWGGLHGAGSADGLRAGKRYAFAPWVQSFQIGFRCAADDPSFSMERK